VKEHTSSAQTDHFAQNIGARQVYIIRNRSNCKDTRVVVHHGPCVVCADHLLNIIWPGNQILASLNPQSDESPATPSDRPTGAPEPPPHAR